MSKRYGLVIDLWRCIGCQTCRIACKSENSLDKGSGIRVDTVGGAHPDTPAGKYPNLSMYYLPVPCMHCGDPACLDACPQIVCSILTLTLLLCAQTRYPSCSSHRLRCTSLWQGPKP